MLYFSGASRKNAPSSMYDAARDSEDVSLALIQETRQRTHRWS